MPSADGALDDLADGRCTVEVQLLEQIFHRFEQVAVDFLAIGVIENALVFVCDKPFDVELLGKLGQGVAVSTVDPPGPDLE